MLYRLVNHLIEEKGYSHQRIGYIFAKAVSELDSRRYLSRLEGPVTRSENDKEITISDIRKSEQHIKARFVRSLAFRILHDYCGRESPSPSISEESISLDRIAPKHHRDSVEEAVYSGIGSSPKFADYLTEAGKRLVDYISGYYEKLAEQGILNEQKGKRFKKRTKENKERKAAKRPNPMPNHDEIYELLRKAFTV